MENNVLKAKIRALKPTINYDFVIYWRNKDGIHGYNVTKKCFTEIYQTLSPLRVDYKINTSEGSYPKILLAINCYDDILEIAQIKVDIHRVKKEETRGIEYHIPGPFEKFNVGRLYLVKDDINVYNEYGDIVSKIGNETVNTYLAKMIRSMPIYYMSSYLLESIQTWWGSSQYGDENIGFSEFYTYNINKFLNYRIKYLKNKKSLGKKKSEVEEIFEKPLTKYDELKLDCIYNNYFSDSVAHNTSYYLKKLYIVEDIDENWTVIREFKHYNYSTDYHWHEINRTFISDKSCISYGKGTYRDAQWARRYFNADMSGFNHENYPVYGFYESKCKRLKYLINLLENDEMNLSKFVAALRYPLIEQGIKSGYESLCHQLILDGAIKTNCKKMFKEYNPKAKSFVELLGVNKYQVKAINSFFHSENRYHNTTNFIEWLKNMLGEDYIYADEKSSTEAIQIYNCMSTSTYCYRRNLIEEFCPNNLPIEKRTWFIKRVYRRAGEQGMRLMKDAIITYRRMPAEERIEFDYDHFNELQDIEHWHNALVDMDLRRRNAIEAEKLKELEKERRKVDKERKNWEYEDEMVIIRLPKTTYEIKEEGALLHHCVGGYVDDHMRGNTTIMFLRDKKDLQNPLCTIEVNNGRVRQIHLKYNAWLGTRPEYIPSVMRWLKQNDFKCEDEILLSTATHYSSRGASWVPKPTID